MTSPNDNLCGFKNIHERDEFLNTLVNNHEKLLQLAKEDNCNNEVIKFFEDVSKRVKSKNNLQVY